MCIQIDVNRTIDWSMFALVRASSQNPSEHLTDPGVNSPSVHGLTPVKSIH